MLEYYKQLVQLGQNYDAVRDGGFRILDNTAEGVLSYARELTGEKNGKIAAVFNRNDVAVQVEVDVSSFEEIQTGVLNMLVQQFLELLS